MRRVFVSCFLYHPTCKRCVLYSRFFVPLRRVKIPRCGSKRPGASFFHVKNHRAFWAFTRIITVLRTSSWILRPKYGGFDPTALRCFVHYIVYDLLQSTFSSPYLWNNDLELLHDGKYHTGEDSSRLLSMGSVASHKDRKLRLLDTRLMENTQNTANGHRSATTIKVSANTLGLDRCCLLLVLWRREHFPHKRTYIE